MTRARLMMFACFCVAFAAGVAAGVVFARSTGKARHDSWIGRELDLTPAQREQMREIWSNVMSTSRRHRFEQRRNLQEEQEAAILGLLSEEQRAKYEEVKREYAEKSAVMEEASRKAFEEARERTKEILTESQRRQYEELLQRGGDRRRHRGPTSRNSMDEDAGFPASRGR